jgi:Ca2+-binding EF-hand superfamily protein
MSEKEVEKLGQLFRKIDINHDGFITIDELKLALSDESAWIDAKDLRNLMDSIDVDKNGKLNYT